MCTAIIGYAPGAPVPVLLAGVRDEMADRPWLPPARHWPARPALVGGLDEQAGGTWLAADTSVPRVACVLNGQGAFVPEAGRLSRGELPLRVAETGTFDGEPGRFEPFHLIGAAADAVRLWSWDGARLTERKLEAGLHIVVNSGLAEPGAPGDDDHMSARVAHFRPRFESALRDRAAWRRVLDGDGLDPAEDRALVVRRVLGGGRTWGTTSVTLIALGHSGIGYDFNPVPGDHDAWHTVRTA